MMPHASSFMQYTYLRMVHVTSWLRNSADLPHRFSVKFCAAACGLPWIFRGIIADYTRKHCWVSTELPYVPAECTAEALPGNIRMRLHSDLWKICAIPCILWVAVTYERNEASRGRFLKDRSEDSRRQFRGLDNLRSPKDSSEDSHKTNPWSPKRQFCRFPKIQFRGSRKTIPRIPKVDSAGSLQTIHEFLHRFSQKAAMDFRGSRKE